MSITIDIQFNQAGDFAALYAARAWCDKNGVSYGPNDRTGTTALMVGDYLVAKWHNLTPAEKAASHGTITGDMRNGPVRIRLKGEALAAARPLTPGQVEQGDLTAERR